ncbi:MAG: type III pantothenate kinase [Tannerella sp.]|nr:type III pantothenate kinase [Tannerella sp.]
MNLIVEQGNTRLKVAVFDDDRRIVSLLRKDNNDASWIDEVFEQYHPGMGIMSSVIYSDGALVGTLQKRLPYFLWLDENVPTPVKIEYETKDTLGKDRIAAVIGATFLKPGQNALVIDAGTAITYEIVEASGVYVGGNISPGLTTRFRALNRFTERLPLVTERNDVPLIGTSTESAILAGVVNGIIFEMDGYIDMLKKKYGDIFVFLTGGHSFYFERRLKSHIFADANLVLIGLNRILEYNAKKN